MREERRWVWVGGAAAVGLAMWAAQAQFGATPLGSALSGILAAAAVLVIGWRLSMR